MPNRSTSGDSKSLGGIIGLIIVVVIIVAGFVATIPVTSAVNVPLTETYTATSTSQYQTSTVSQMPITEQTTTNEGIFQIGTTLLAHGYYVHSSSNLPAGADVQISWTTDNSVNVYIFTSSEYSAFVSNTKTTPNVASQTNTGSGGLSVIVSAPDNYYEVLYNTNNGFLGIGAKNDTVSSTGTVSFNTQTTVYVAQTNTFIATTTVYSVITTVSTSTSTTTCSVPFWNWLTGAKC